MSLRVLFSLACGSTAVAVLGYVAVQSGTASESVPLVLPAVAPALPGQPVQPGQPVRPVQPAQPVQGLAPAAAQAPSLIDPDWLRRMSARTGIPEPALRAYATAQLRVADESPGCGLGWTTLAGIGWVESQHGTYAGRTLGEDGVPSAPILGLELDGSGDVAAVAGEDGGWAKAAGPMQFIPSTWRTWASDGDGDGVRDEQDLDDAAYAAGRYLCASGALTDGSGWARAVFSYNHSQAYVDQVHAAAQTYADRTS